MTVVGTAEVEIRSDGSKFATDAEKDIKGAMGGVESSVTKSAKAIGGALAAAFAVEKVTAFAGDVIGAASDMQETLSKSKNVFGAQAGAIEQWANTAAKSFGISKQAALAATAQYGDMFKQLGFTGDAARQASTDLVKTAADLGSFHNVDPSDVLERIGASLRGEFDSLQQLIPNINAARVETEALAMTHKKSAKELTAAEKATATLAIIQKDGALAANDFAETSGGLANRQRILAAQFEDIKAKIGNAFLPAVNAAAGFLLNNLFPAFEKIGGAISKVKNLFGDLFASRDASAGVTIGTLFGLEEDSKGVDKIITTMEEARGRVKDAISGIRQSIAGDVAGGGVSIGKVFGLEEDSAATDKIISTLETLKSAFGALSDYVGEKFTEISVFAQTKWPEVQEAISHVMNAIRDAIHVAIEVIQAAWNMFGDNILQGVQNRWELIKRTIDNVLEVIKSTITFWLAIINGDWDKAWNNVLNIMAAVWDQIEAILRFNLAELRNILSAAWDVIKVVALAAWDQIKFDITAKLRLVKEAVSFAMNAVKDDIEGKLNLVVGIFSSMGSKIRTATSGMFDGIRDAFKGAMNWVIDKWNGLEFTIGGQKVFGQELPGATIGTPNISRFAAGGIAQARPGGVFAQLAEAGTDEAIVPMNTMFVDMLVSAMVRAGLGGGKRAAVENLTIMNSKTLQENLDEVDRLNPPLIGVY